MSFEIPGGGRLLGPRDGEELTAAGGVVQRILEEDERIGVLECRVPPGWAGPPQHVHREHDETFYVVSGVIRFASGAERRQVGPGSFFSAPIGTPHGFGNAQEDEPALMLCTVSPQRYVQYFRELEQATASQTTLDPAVLRELMQRYATELYGP